MFRSMRDAKAGARLSFTFDGRPLTGREGDTVTASLLANGVTACRETPVSGVPRAPYCLMGVCFDCLVVIDGIGNRQGCLVPLREGMRIETQHGRRQPEEVYG
ncbi:MULTISPECIES: (2Fe-2S)-binding protein [unclassified Bosea (in: a-proteobacteria)]|uniref:(2Fe-2S)-binding protein n=1 Tax=unclassified Bosea (in: a-proteobacteria) TaxID=2653178 RepID=UPI000F760192|nr:MULTISPECIES: (2Fe-2S)-binding protein [unclassified Bosea (in: a-proteobacteria)]AZO79132.1 (2Fe-2S)-binding protein [Bosea sp. Tri-49]RXT27473.1 (2Fe-2S)-binding protein [Bosea sp. Tri-39]RXT35822.1 (2Fe-2S)-binding protein [Bosea sp. Tri-54]